jgi:hypothetical protein
LLKSVNFCAKLQGVEMSAEEHREERPTQEHDMRRELREEDERAKDSSADPEATQQWSLQDARQRGVESDAEDEGQEELVLPVRAEHPREPEDERPLADETVVMTAGELPEPPEDEPELERVEVPQVSRTEDDREQGRSHVGIGGRLQHGEPASDETEVASRVVDPGRRISTQESIVMSVAISGSILLLLGLGFGLFMLAALDQLDLQSLPLSFVLVILLIFAVIAVLVYNLCVRLMGRK